MKAAAWELPAEAVSDPHRCVLPRYWIDRVHVERVAGAGARWFVVFRDMTNVMTNRRNAVFCILPLSGVAHSAPIITVEPVSMSHVLLANFNSFIFDYLVRQKLGGGHLTFFILKQLPVLPPSVFSHPAPWSSDRALAEWITCCVLELSYTSWDLQAFASSCRYYGPPFRWDEDRRFLIRCELDAAYFHLYGIARGDVDYILETFPIVRRKDVERHGEYRTKRVILEVYDAMAEAVRTGQPYQTIVSPPPADPSVAHGSRG